MKILDVNKLNADEIKCLFKRPAINNQKILDIVKPVLEEIKLNGIDAVLKYARKFDGLATDNIQLSKDEICKGANLLDEKVKRAINSAYENILKFHQYQKPEGYSVEIMPGIKCFRQYRPIENVGLYIPGGTAVLPSTMLMLGIPAGIAGCKRIVVCSPAKNGIVNPALLYAAEKCGIEEFYIVGGAQAIGLMAYGASSIPKVDKIFGPGSQFVTAAKSIVSVDPDGCAIDMPAGPSEVLIIADKTANPEFIAADLLSQAEHGLDSQAILVTTEFEIAQAVSDAAEKQSETLKRKEFADSSLNNSYILVVNNIKQAIEFSNGFAPEHLILSIENINETIKDITNAGSVFLGNYSPESAGDYASGTNHSLPTYGYAKSFSGVNVESFLKGITFQELTHTGLKSISETVITLAETEDLQAHVYAVKIRMKNGN